MLDFLFARKKKLLFSRNSSSSQQSLTKKQLGQEGEQLALAFLKQKGMVLIAQNFYCRFGEIDLIMRESGKPNYLLFIEVRYRKNSGYGSALESIDANKQKKLRKTAEYFLLKNPEQQILQPRFDVVIIPPGKTEKNINWLKNAF